MNTNGPAVEVVNVTRRKHRHNPGSLARKLSRCKEGMAQFLQIPAKDKVVSVTRKNCDKFITPTVRVSLSFYFFL
jgi:hypothetical protein